MLDIIEGIKHPRKILLYLLLGEARHSYMQSNHTCYQAKDVALPFPQTLVLEPTDIHEHLTTLYMLTVQLNLRTIVELGTKTGQSTLVLLHAARSIDGRVYSFDVDECARAKNTVKRYGLERYWEFTQADDLSVRWNAPIDHLFIDTNHKFDHTLGELRKYEPYVRSGGVITMHDPVLYPEVMEATREHLKGRTDIKIYEYVNNNGLLVLFK